MPYRITLANQGNTSATGEVVRSDIPEGELLEPGSLQTSKGTISTCNPIAAAVGEVAPGETQETVSILDAYDLLDEMDERFTLVLSSPQGAAISDPDASITIRHDDDATSVGLLTVDDLSVTEGDSGTTDARFTVRLASAISTEVGGAYATAAGTATSGNRPIC